MRSHRSLKKNLSSGRIVHAKLLHSFAEGDWVFITFKYILESLLSENVLNVANFKLAAGENVSRRNAKDVHLLLKRQQQQQQKQPMTKVEHVKTFRKCYKIKNVFGSDSNS